MAFNKTKILDAAQKHLNQGKLSQAIAQYQEILRHEPNDQVTLMTIGDLYVRNNNIDEATDYFERLAKILLNNGFLSKGIAIYKKIAKLSPDQTRPLERLAELYVQQGVLSEARPIYLQLAEGYLKQKNSEKAVGMLRKLLEAEPDNLRVQHRLAELYTAMGQSKEATAVYQMSARRLADSGEWQQALDMAEQILKSDSKSSVAHGIQARALASLGKTQEAVAVLEALPMQQEPSETTELLLDIYLAAGEFARATDLSQKVFEANLKNYSYLFKTASAILDSGEPAKALPLLDQIRIVMIESGESDRIAATLATAAERNPTNLEPLEWLVDLFGRTNDSFRLPNALMNLGVAAMAAGRLEQAHEALEQALDRNPDDETIQTRLAQVRARLGKSAPDPENAPAPPVAPEDPNAREVRPPSPDLNLDLDEDTRRYVSQALTDVDLFSSYGLTSKAIDLLEQVIARVPRHTQALERLLDLYLGAGDDRHTADISATLEEIYQSAGDTASADRFAELRRRYQRALDRAPAPPPPSEKPTVAEFDVQPIRDFTAPPPEPAPPADLHFQKAPPAAAGDSFTDNYEEQEVDLSAEWAEFSEQLTTESPAPASEDVNLRTEEIAPEGPAVAEEIAAQALPDSPADIPVEATAESPVEEDAPVEFDLVPSSDKPPEEPAPMSADQFIDEMVADLESLGLAPHAEREHSDAPHAEPPAPVEASSPDHSSPSQPEIPAHIEPEPVFQASAVPSGHLSEVFEEFRAELGEMNEESEDLETHYNLGVAYREMGLLEEAIGEFQKVAKAVQNGKPFAYSMQCCTLLGLIFMDRGEPAISAMWYDRALETPGLDQEAILALRYDLGVAQEAAGDFRAARENFSRVYALNIDYRDVAERLAALEKRASLTPL